MCRMIKSIISACFAMTLILVTASPAYAADSDTLSINGDADVAVGETVKYTLYLGDASDPIAGFELRVFYDSESLEYQKGSITFENFDVVIYNEDIKGRIPMNCSALNNLPDFSKRSQFVSLDFKVLKAGTAQIDYFFTDLYGKSMENLNTYTITYDLTSGDKKLVDNAVPPVNSDPKTLSNYQGDLVNYEDGKGDGNGSGEEHRAVLSSEGTLAPYVVDKVQTITKEVSVGSKGKSGGISASVVVLFIALPLIIGAIVAAVIVVSVKNKKEAAEALPEEINNIPPQG